MKILTKHISCECKCKFHGGKLIQIKSGKTINNGASVKIKKKTTSVQKILYLDYCYT